MKRKMLINMAVSGFVLGVATGCSGTGSMAHGPSLDAGTPAAALKSAERARKAIEGGKTAKAVVHAEAAVATSPRDAGLRALLGQAYLNDGRFASAEHALGEALELGATDANTIIALSLAQIAQGKRRDAIDLLASRRSDVPPSDLGLALALAGDSEASIYVLTEAARAKDATARTRQNLALALALSGRWAQARIVASQDLARDKVEKRMTQWSELAAQPNGQVRVASLIGASVKGDAGMPAQLALVNVPATGTEAPPAVQLASADPAPVELYAPPPAAAPVKVAAAPAPIRTVELPMPQRTAEGVVPVSDLPQPAAASPVILADAAPYRHAPSAEIVRPAQRQAIDLATRLIPAAMGFDSKKPDGWAVQLGAYDSLAVAKEKWGALQKRNPSLAGFPASSHAAVVKGRTFYRLTVNGLKSKGDARTLCEQLKAEGQRCFVREMGGSEAIQWAAKARPVQLASR